MSAAILIDTTKCTGCERCVVACKEENGLGPDRLKVGQESVDSLSSTRFTTVLSRPGDHYVKQQCRHCLEPACVSACLVGAMQQTPEGPVIYDSELCMGCRYCMVACPYGIPRYDWDRSVPYVRKCELCYDRIKEGRDPACVEACPEGALEFGERDTLLERARERIAAEPDRYVPHVYGEKEVGGTNVLYLSGISLGFLSWSPRDRETSLPKLTWKALSKVPWEIAGMGGVMGGVYWVINRRMSLASQAAEDARMEEAAVHDEAAPSDATDATETEGPGDV